MNLDGLWMYILTNLANGLLMVLILFGALWVGNRATRMDFWDELTKGNMAVAVMIGAFAVALALVLRQ